MIVVDAGALVEVVLRSAAGGRVGDLLQHDDAYAPDLIDAECLAVLARAARRGSFTGVDLRARIARVAEAPIERLASRALLPLAATFTVSLSGYDALYAAAAEAIGATLVTTDGGLAATAADQFGLAVTHVPATSRR